MKWLRELIHRFRHKPARQPVPLKTERVEEVPDELNPHSVYLVGEGCYLWFAAMICPCGCGATLYMNLMPDSRPRWNVIEEEDGTVTLEPSIWRQKGCHSHFFLRKGLVEWCRLVPSPVDVGLDDDAQIETQGLTPTFWNRLDLSRQKADELLKLRRQSQAVMHMVKVDLAQKLQYFPLLYFIVFLITFILCVASSKILPGLGGQDKLKLIFASNFIYFAFLMVLSLFYELRLRIKWYFALAAFAFVALWPYLRKYLIASISLKALIVTAIIVLPLISFFSISHKGRQLWAWFMRIRKQNITERNKRAEFEKRIIEFFQIWDKPSYLWLRKLLFKSASRVVYSILTSDEFENPKVALQEFVKQHRFKTSMGRLATSIWTAGAFAYLIFPNVPDTDVLSGMVASVLPVYALCMLIMDQIDAIREEAIIYITELVCPKINNQES